MCISLYFYTAIYKNIENKNKDIWSGQIMQASKQLIK